MSEFKSKKSSERKPFGKSVGGSRVSKNTTSGVRKKREGSEKSSDEDMSSKKTYSKRKTEDTRGKSRRSAGGLVPKTKKRFSDFEDKEKSKSYGEKSDKKDFKSRKPYKKEGESRGSDKPFKKEFTRKTEYKPKKTYADDGDNVNGEKPYKKEISKKTEYKSKRSFSKNAEKRSAEKSYKKDFGDKKVLKPGKSYSDNAENKGYEKKYKKEYKSSDKERDKVQSAKKSSGGEAFLGVVRLNRYIAASGMCSRREADELIELGEVKVNGVVVTEMGTKVSPTDRVEVGGQSITPEKKVYILLNKPKDFVSTVSDPHADRTVLDLINLEGHERIYPVGRLDKNTTGVMLLTNDGDLTKKLTHPSYNKKKIYHVVLDKPATKANLQEILEGFVLEDGFVSADAISFVIEGDKTEIGIEIHSGRNRIVRRIFEHLGFDVVKLDRVYFAGLTKKNLARGKWRYLSDKEIGMLKMGAYE